MDQSALRSCTVQTNPAPGLLLSNLGTMMMTIISQIEHEILFIVFTIGW